MEPEVTDRVAPSEAGRSTGDGAHDGHVMTGIVRRNIGALTDRQQMNERRTGVQDRIAEAITRFTGSMRFVYIHLAIYGTWIIWNLGWLGLPRFDRSFVVLAMAASVEAIFLSTFVLISQNRMNEQADLRADLDLQISLLAEHEVTRLITMVSAVARTLGVEEAQLAEIPELEQDVHPEDVLDELEQRR